MLFWILLLIFVLLFFIIISLIFKGFLKEISESENYIKFVQFIIIVVLLFVFVAIVIYFWINKIEVNNMAVIFTVIVGWLGLIIGAFFGQKFMENVIEHRRQLSGRNLLYFMNKYEIYINRLLKTIEDYKEEIKRLRK